MRLPVAKKARRVSVPSIGYRRSIKGKIRCQTPCCMFTMHLRSRALLFQSCREDRRNVQQWSLDSLAVGSSEPTGRRASRQSLAGETVHGRLKNARAQAEPRTTPPRSSSPKRTSTLPPRRSMPNSRRSSATSSATGTRRTTSTLRCASSPSSRAPSSTV